MGTHEPWARITVVNDKEGMMGKVNRSFTLTAFARPIARLCESG